jgi:hypothetical protein
MTALRSGGLGRRGIGRRRGRGPRLTAPSPAPATASTGAHIWADRFDGALDDIFDLQDQITATVVAAISPRMEQAEIQRAKRKPTANLNAYDYFLHGMASVHDLTREATDEALRLFYKAIEIDRDFAEGFRSARDVEARNR